MSVSILTISSKNYSSWSLRGWLLCKMAGIAFEERVLPIDDPLSRAELLLLSPSFLVPSLSHNGIEVWDTLAIAEYLQEVKPKAGLFPRELADRTWCRAISGEMHSGFSNLRAALPMNIKARHNDFKIWDGAQADIDRITTIWRACLAASDGPFLFGATPSVADAMYAPVCSRFLSYDVPLDPVSASYRSRMMAWAPMQEWIAGAMEEPDDFDELDVEF